MDLKLKDVAQLLHVSESTIRRWLAEGKIPVYRLNQQYRFSREEIENWMVKCKLKEKESGFLPFAQDQEATSASSRAGSQQFSLYRAIHQGGVIAHIESKSKEEVIRQTTHLIAPRLHVDGEVLTELLLDREKLMPTGLNNGVAVPHTRDFLLQGPLDLIAAVFPKEPLEYGSLDGKPVHTLFFLFAISDKRHLHLLAKLAHLCSSEACLAFLRSRPQEGALLDYVKAWEASMPQHGNAS